MKYALIGCGRISPNHIMAAINNNLEIVAICDAEPGNMKDITAAGHNILSDCHAGTIGIISKRN